MKITKLFTLLIVILLSVSLVACGGEDSSDEGNKDTTQPENQSSELAESVSEGSDNAVSSAVSNGDIAPADEWNDPKYADYTNGLEEPSFSYVIKGVIMEQLTINAEATEEEVNAWKQSLLDSGFEEYREGEQWGINNETHNIQMNGFVNGIAYIYIGIKQA